MKKIMSILIGMLFSINIFSQEMTCMDKLLPYNRHSGVHQLSNEEWPGKKGNFNPDKIEKALEFLLYSKLLCRNSEILIKVKPVCSPILPDITQSNTCFAFTSLGYFIISKDNVQNFNFIFTRDKRFSDRF
jgi:hypothetical protein